MTLFLGLILFLVMLTLWKGIKRLAELRISDERND